MTQDIVITVDDTEFIIPANAIASMQDHLAALGQVLESINEADITIESFIDGHTATLDLFTDFLALYIATLPNEDKEEAFTEAFTFAVQICQKKISKGIATYNLINGVPSDYGNA